MPLSLGPAVDRHSSSRPAVGATGMHDRTNCKDLPSRARENATVKFSILDSLAEATSGSPFPAQTAECNAQIQRYAAYLRFWGCHGGSTKCATCHQLHFKFG